MFSQELANLILATLEDGVLEDYEKAAHVKRAQSIRVLSTCRKWSFLSWYGKTYV
jgi:hypothetical protein